MLNYSSWKIFYLGKFLLRMCACFSEKVPKGGFINTKCPWRVILIDSMAICPGQMCVLEEDLSGLPVGVSEGCCTFLAHAQLLLQLLLKGQTLSAKRRYPCCRDNAFSVKEFAPTPVCSWDEEPKCLWLPEECVECSLPPCERVPSMLPEDALWPAGQPWSPVFVLRANLHLSLPA